MWYSHRVAPHLDHVAILVSDLDAAVSLYRDVYGLPLHAIEEVATEKVRVAIFGEGAGRVELICPIDPNDPSSSIVQRLKARGEGLHHICIRVTDIERAMEALRAKGTPLLDEKPRTGAGGTRVAFVHPKGSRGVLVELSEKP
jgi:methylmalonyl-CoA/ethylmalonyl-CoA epimerase